MTRLERLVVFLGIILLVGTIADLGLFRGVFINSLYEQKLEIYLEEGEEQAENFQQLVIQPPEMWLSYAELLISLGIVVFLSLTVIFFKKQLKGVA